MNLRQSRNDVREVSSQMKSVLKTRSRNPLGPVIGGWSMDIIVGGDRLEKG